METRNFTANSVMGGDRYMQLVSQRSVGFHSHADSTDVANAGEGEEQAEEEAAACSCATESSNEELRR